MLLKMAMRFKENSLPDDIALIAIPVFCMKLKLLPFLYVSVVREVSFR